MEVSKHGEKRVRKRLGLPKKTVERMAQKALREGKPRREYTGRLRRYLDKMWHEGGRQHRYLVCDDYVFIFAKESEVLVTTWQLPQGMRGRK